MKLSNKLLPLIAISCLLTTQSHAGDLSANTKPADYVMIEKANKIMCEFCITIKEFFNRQNKESFNSHLQRFATVIASVEFLTNEIKTKFEETKSIKHKAFLDILNELKAALNISYSALQTKNSKNIMLTFKNSLSQKFIQGTKSKLENAKQYLTENEKNLVNNILDSSENVLKTLPCDIACAAIISNIVKR